MEKTITSKTPLPKRPNPIIWTKQPNANIKTAKILCLNLKSNNSFLAKVAPSKTAQYAKSNTQNTS